MAVDMGSEIERFVINLFNFEPVLLDEGNSSFFSYVISRFTSYILTE